MAEKKIQHAEDDAQAALLQALLDKNLEMFSNLLDSGQVNPSYRYGKPHFATCLEIACRRLNLLPFVNKLLECGAKPNVNTIVPEPIHYAARSGNSEALSLLLSNPKTRVNATDSSGHTALHSLVVAFKDSARTRLAKRFEACIELLVNCARFDINIIDNKGFSALHLAANTKRRKAAELIIDKSKIANRELDIDRHLVKGRTARQALEALLPDVTTRVPEAGGHIPASKKRLLQAMDLADFPLYQRLLKRAAREHDFDPDSWFEEPYNTRLLERACGQRDPELAAKFVKVTLDAGAKASSVNLCNWRTPLHVAAASGNSAALKILLERAPDDVNAKDTNDQTALHLAASCTSSTHSHECLELLLNAENVDVDVKDTFGHTPADVAGCHVALSMIQRKSGKKIGAFLNTAEGVNDSFNQLSMGDHGELAAMHGDVIIPLSVPNNPGPDEPTTGHSSRGFTSDGGSKGCFAEGYFSISGFGGSTFGPTPYLDGDVESVGGPDSGSISDGSSDTQGGDTGFRTDGNVGAGDGAHGKQESTYLKKRLFDLMVKGQYANFEEEFEKLSFSDALLDSAECGYTFLQYACERSLHDFAKKLLEKVNPNATHKRETRTPLMLSCLQNDKKMVYMLLNTKSKMEIDINAVDHKRNTALHFAAKNDVEIVVELLSRGADLLTKNVFGKYPLSAEEILTLLNQSLSARDNNLPSNDDYAIKFSYKMLISRKKAIKPEATEGKSFAVQSNTSYPDATSDKSKLMESPLEDTNKEMDILHSFTNLPGHTLLLKHPLIVSYLQVKNDHMRCLRYLNLMLYLVFVITLNVYLLMQVNIDRTSVAVQSIDIFFCMTALICTIFMLFREVTQLVLKTNLYFQNSENVYDVSLITFAFLSLSQFPLGSFARWAYTGAILLSWRGLFVITGRHYKFSTNVEMLRAVSVNYLHLLKSYIFIIVAFSLSFYVIFSPPVNQTASVKSTNEKNITLGGIDLITNSEKVSESADFFHNPLRTFLKTLIMMTGEFDANNLPFISDIWLSSIVFILFLFYLPVVLLNLLTALAVSDTQQIRGCAEILSIISQIKCLYEIENITVCLSKLCRRWKYVAQIFQNLLLFSQNSQEEACLIVWPNKGAQTKLSGEQGKLLKPLDYEIVNEAKRILCKRDCSSADSSSEVSNLSLLLERIERVESSLMILERQQQKAEL